MNETAQFLIQHGYALLFTWVLIEQLGLPVPAIPLLLAAGALAGSGRMDLALAVCLAVIAVILADIFWYYLGRHRGGRILKFLCRISLEPDSCVRRTESVFARHGAHSLLVAKFVPGLNTAAPSLAGIFRMPVPRFMLFDSLGAFFWVATFAGLGFIFSDQFEQIGAYLLRWGGWLAVALAGSLTAYISWKYFKRRRFLRQLRIARIGPKELMEKLSAGDEVLIVDLRQPLDVEAFPQVIPGALRMARWKSLKDVTRKFPATARLSFTARDPMRRPAPGWRCCCAQKESPGSARSRAGSMLGSRINFPR